MPTKSLPHRFSEKAFRKYEPAIRALIEAWPNPVLIDPSSYGLSCETVRGRLRDAITSYADHWWVSNLFQPDSFNVIHNQNLRIIILPDGRIKAGHKDSFDTSIAPAVFDVPSSDIVDLTSPEISSHAKSSFARLAHERALSKRLRLRMPPELAEELTSMFDISLDQQLDGTYLLS